MPVLVILLASLGGVVGGIALDRKVINPDLPEINVYNTAQPPQLSPVKLGLYAVVGIGGYLAAKKAGLIGK